MKGERKGKLANTVLGESLLHKLVKLSTLIVPTVVALISDLVCKTCFLIPSFVGGFIGMTGMIYFNIVRARKSHRGT